MSIVSNAYDGFRLMETVLKATEEDYARVIKEWNRAREANKELLEALEALLDSALYAEACIPGGVYEAIAKAKQP